MRRLVHILVLGLLAPACARAQYPPPAAAVADVFPEIPAVRAVRGVARVTLDVVIDPVTGYPAFEWGTRLGEAPTIRVAPGDAIEMTVRNGMRAFAGRRDDVNVHFHGLTVSPAAPGDDAIMTIARPGETLHYRVEIPRDHEPGLYWYHPHAHGESYYDVTNGMAGAIVVEGIQRRLPALAGMRERVIVLRDVPRGPGFVDDDMPMTGTATQPRSRRIGRAASGKPCRAETTLQPTLNRQAAAHIGIRAGERQFFRVVNASAARYYDLSVDGTQLDVVALDGVPLDAAPHMPAVKMVAHLILPPAARAEFVVTAPPQPTVLRSACVDTGRAGDPAPAVVLAQLIDPAVAAGLPQPAPTPAASSAIPLRPAGDAARDPRARALPEPAARRTIRFSENARGFFINGAAYAMGASPMFTVRSGTLEEWTIENTTDEVHAFHIHQVHFLTEAVDGGTAPVGVWLDTVSISPQRHLARGGTVSGRARLLVDFRSPVVRGTFLFHCHILDHEDQGMMATVRVI
jgi:FtsP/CotA-like multicopper oxidase with cupredoxin domain